MPVKKGGVNGVYDKSYESSSYNAAMAAVVRAPPKDFLIIQQEWDAIRIQAVFRSFLALVRVHAQVRASNVRRSPEEKVAHKLLDGHHDQDDSVTEAEMSYQ
ncbi:unnamed protein product [Lupinus luteus]|uniref:Uncharacterized protein n=1 Tax=Lupinus luteus TaxID=3873 RepID=A0AAV1VSV3_LUPLU